MLNSLLETQKHLHGTSRSPRQHAQHTRKRTRPPDYSRDSHIPSMRCLRLVRCPSGGYALLAVGPTFASSSLCRRRRPHLSTSRRRPRLCMDMNRNMDMDKCVVVLAHGHALVIGVGVGVVLRPISTPTTQPTDGPM